MSDCSHKVTIRTWEVEQNMVQRSCERCGESVFVSLPSPPQGAGHKSAQWREF